MPRLIKPNIYASLPLILNLLACSASPTMDFRDVIDSDPIDDVYGTKSTQLALEAHETSAVLRVANTATLEALDDDARLNARAAKNIIAHRKGSDGREPTADDNHFDTLDELDSVRYVGPTALGALLAYAQALGEIQTAPSQDQASDAGILYLANNLSQEELDDVVRLDTRAANNIAVQRQGPDGIICSADDNFFQSVAELDSVSWVGQRALTKLRTYAATLGQISLETTLCDAPEDEGQGDGPCDGFEFLDDCYNVSENILEQSRDRGFQRHWSRIDDNGKLHTVWQSGFHQDLTWYQIEDNEVEETDIEVNSLYGWREPEQLISHPSGSVRLFSKHKDRRYDGSIIISAPDASEAYLRCHDAAKNAQDGVNARYNQDGSIRMAIQTIDSWSSPGVLHHCEENGDYWDLEVVDPDYGQYCLQAIANRDDGSSEIYSLCNQSLSRYTRSFDGWHKTHVLDVEARYPVYFKLVQEGAIRHLVMAAQTFHPGTYDYDDTRGEYYVHMLSFDDAGSLQHHALTSTATGINRLDAHLTANNGLLVTLANQNNHTVSAFRVDHRGLENQTFQDSYTQTNILPGQSGEFFMTRLDAVNDRIIVHTLTP